MHLCYIDESGTPEIPGNTSHFILAGVALPIEQWKSADRDITNILTRYGLANDEFHTAWLLRMYPEQSKIPNFERLDWVARRGAVLRKRTEHLLRLQQAQNSKAYRQVKKNYRHTETYIHLTKQERVSLVGEVASLVAGWQFCRLFAECIDKVHFDPTRTSRTVEEQAFEQIVSRFHRYLTNTETAAQRNYGLLVHDNNQSVAKKHTDLMRHFHSQGTLWTTVTRIIETPMFVDSKLTRMVQIADLCAVALRLYVEKNQTDLFRPIFARADRVLQTVVGVRHFSSRNCVCDICTTHRV